MAYGTPSGMCLTAPRRAAKAALYPATASGELFMVSNALRQRSIAFRASEGQATQRQRRAHAPDSRVD